MISNFLFGDINPTEDIGTIGDFYINTTSKVVWNRTIDGWKSMKSLSSYINNDVKTTNFLSLSGISSTFSDFSNDLWEWIKRQDGQTIFIIVLLVVLAFFVLTR